MPGERKRAKAGESERKEKRTKKVKRWGVYLGEEGGTDGRLLVLKELVAHEADHEARLADGRI